MLPAIAQGRNCDLFQFDIFSLGDQHHAYRQHNSHGDTLLIDPSQSGRALRCPHLIYSYHPQCGNYFYLLLLRPMRSSERRGNHKYRSMADHQQSIGYSCPHFLLGISLAPCSVRQRRRGEQYSENKGEGTTSLSADSDHEDDLVFHGGNVFLVEYSNV